MMLSCGDNFVKTECMMMMAMMMILMVLNIQSGFVLFDVRLLFFDCLSACIALQGAGQ